MDAETLARFCGAALSLGLDGLNERQLAEIRTARQEIRSVLRTVMGDKVEQYIPVDGDPRDHVKLIRGHRLLWQSCTRCKIGEYARNHVFYRGAIPADVLLIGEGPGKNEDAEGKPFVGRSGELLDEAIAEAWPLEAFPELRWCITNTVLCRPCDSPGGPNRAPDTQEILNCRPRLAEIIDFAGARAIVRIGKVAEEGTPAEILPRECRVWSIQHPAYLLRNGWHPVRPSAKGLELFGNMVLALRECAQWVRRTR